MKPRQAKVTPIVAAIPVVHARCDSTTWCGRFLSTVQLIAERNVDTTCQSCIKAIEKARTEEGQRRVERLARLERLARDAYE